MNTVLYPLFAMVALTFGVLMFAFGQRVTAVRSRQIRFSYFRTMQAEQVPEHLIIGARHFANLFEMPVLFYVVCVLALVLQMQSTLMVGLAWGFVVFRLVHTLVHLSYNNVTHRVLAFFMSNGFLLAMWIMVFLKTLS